TMLAGAADRQSITVGIEIQNHLPSIKGDKTRLMQVVLNILKNSIDSLAEPVAEKYIRIKAGVEGEWVIVRVRDSGSGFPAFVAERLFERGFTTKRSGAGTGLYNSRAIIESHGGCIEVSSEGPGKGAVARIALPFSELQNIALGEGSQLNNA